MKDFDYVKINSVNPLHFIINEANGSIEEKKNGNKYLTFADTDQNKQVLEKYKKHRDELRYHIKTVNAGEFIESGEYEKDYMKNQI